MSSRESDHLFRRPLSSFHEYYSNLSVLHAHGGGTTGVYLIHIPCHSALWVLTGGSVGQVLLIGQALRLICEFKSVSIAVIISR